MTDHVINETAGTNSVDQPPCTESGTTQRPGVTLARWVLGAVLTTAATAPRDPLFRQWGHVAESSTAAVKRDVELLRQVQNIFEQGASEIFYDGVYSTFSRRLVAMLAQHGRAGFQAISEYIFSGGGNPDVVSESLRWLSDFDDPATLPQQMAILQQTLKSESPKIRDGSILGFASLDDPATRPLLEQSARTESTPELQHLIQQVIEQLNSTDAADPAQR